MHVARVALIDGQTLAATPQLSSPFPIPCPHRHKYDVGRVDACLSDVENQARKCCLPDKEANSPIQYIHQAIK